MGTVCKNRAGYEGRKRGRATGGLDSRVGRPVTMRTVTYLLSLKRLVNQSTPPIIWIRERACKRLASCMPRKFDTGFPTWENTSKMTRPSRSLPSMFASTRGGGTSARPHHRLHIRIHPIFCHNVQSSRSMCNCSDSVEAKPFSTRTHAFHSFRTQQQRRTAAKKGWRIACSCRIGGNRNASAAGGKGGGRSSRRSSMWLH